MSRYILPLVGLALLLPVVSRSQDTIPVIISASGGVSKGVYQGGLDWTINEFLRRQRSAEWRATTLGLQSDTAWLPYELTAAAGASAGNVNALIGALGWCTDSVLTKAPIRAALAAKGSAPPSRRNIAPERSLYWMAWVNTGLNELLPKDALSSSDGEFGILDRSFFYDHHRDSVLAFLESAVPMPKCKVPLGLTLTRVQPIVAGVQREGVSAHVQRFASVMQVERLPVPPGTAGAQGRPRLGFRELQSLGSQNGRSLGALALLPSLRSSAEVADSARFNRVFEVMLASSSFPVAFAPRRIEYLRGGLALEPGDTVAHAPEEALFADGGVFDNNPFGLGLRLHELASSDSRPPILLNSTHAFPRGRLAAVRGEQPATEDRSGLGATLQLLSGMATAAPEYELQSLLRQTARDRDRSRGDTNTVRRSTRSSPIFGEYLVSFAAFLGRPLREYDFYAGVYDGLHFVARHLICSKPASTAPVAAVDVATCTDSVHSALITQNAFEIGPVGQTVLTWLRDIEYQDHARPVDIVADNGSDRDVRDRLVLLRGIHNAALPLRQRELATPCPDRTDLIGKALCESGLDEFTSALRSDTAFMRVVTARADECDVPTSTAMRESGQCMADQMFVDFVCDPEELLDKVIGRALVRLQRAEDALKNGGGNIRHFGAWTELALLLYRSTNHRYRRGFEVNPSSADFEPGLSRRLLGMGAMLAPNYVLFAGGGWGAEGPDGSTNSALKSASIAPTLGWRPLVYHVKQVVVNSTLELSHFDDLSGADPSRHAEWAWGGSISVDDPLWVFSSLELGGATSRHLLASVVDDLGYRPVYQISGRFLADKLLLSVRTSPKRGWAVVAGISDLNGVLYWWLR